MGTGAEPGTSSGRPLLVTTLFGLGAFALGVVGLSLELDTGVFDVAYRSLQLFVLDGGALMEVPNVNAVLQVARFLAPAVTVTAVLLGLRSLFHEELRRRRIARTTGHTIVCGDDAAAHALARNLRRDGAAVVLVVPPDASPEWTAAGVSTVLGDAREPEALQAAGIAGAAAVYALAGSSAVNAAVALAAGRIRGRSTVPLATFAQVRREELVDALRVRRIGADRPVAVTMDFFSITDIAARALLARHPVGDGTPVVVGFGEMGQAVLRVLTRAPATDGARSVVVASAGSARLRDESAGYPANAAGWDVRRGAETDGDGPVYVCLDDEDDAVATGLRLTTGSARLIVVCLRRAAPFAQALDTEARLKIFGVLDEACHAGAIADDSIVGRTARAIHERYLAAAIDRHEGRSANRSAVPWDELPDHLKRANVAQAEHIGAKLLEIGVSLGTRPPAQPFAFADDEILRLAQVEHARWKVERERAGFRHGPSRTDDQHPDLVDWPDLTDAARDRDIDAVRHLPTLLAAEGLYVRRGPPV